MSSAPRSMAKVDSVTATRPAEAVMEAMRGSLDCNSKIAVAMFAAVSEIASW